MSESKKTVPGKTVKPPGMARKVLGVALGLGILKRNMATFRSLLWNNDSRWGFQDIRTSLEALKIRRSATDKSSESFAEACERMNLTVEDLAARREDLAFQGLIFRVLGYCSLILCLGSAVLASSFFWFSLLTLNGLCTAAMFFGMAFVRYFRAWQIEQQDLAPMAAFVKAGGVYRAFL